MENKEQTSPFFGHVKKKLYLCSVKQNKWLSILVWAATVAVVLLLAACGLAWLSEHNWRAKDGESHLLYIYPQTTYAEILTQVEADYDVRFPLLSLALEAKKLTDCCVRTGCYRLESQMSDRRLWRMLRNGEQVPVKMTFNNIRLPEELARRLGAQLMIDSADIASCLNDSAYMSRFGLSLPEALCLFIPNTYEVWWNMSTDELFERMAREYRAFWNETRRARCREIGLTPQQAVTLASIVEEETRVDSDKPKVAGLYLNRLRRGMLLQADPTVRYATGNFGTRRVLHRDLEVDSPYNTYRYAGLPPGPIRIPTAKTVEYVLHYTPSNYLYMCASPELDGTHRFTDSYAVHMRNARDYQRELNKRGIRR